MYYTMNSAILKLGYSFNDLGIIFECKLDFRNYITSTVSKATCILVFIKRWAKEFSDPYVAKQLFTTLVRPILEHRCITWDP